MEIIKEFGIDPVLLIAQVVNILIVLFILKRFLYKSIIDMLKKRQDDIKEGLRQSEEARALLEKSQEEEKTILKMAQEEAKKLILNARERAQKTAEEIEENARVEAERMLTDGREQIQIESKEAEKNLTLKINDLSIELLTNALKGMFTKEEEKKVIERALKKIKG